MTEAAEWFRPTSGRLTGVLTEVLLGLLLVVAVMERDQDYALPMALGAGFAATLAWATMLRPGLGVTPTTLVLRNMVETVHVPLAAIEELAIRQVLAVRVGDRRFVSPAVGKSWRKALTSSAATQEELTPEQALARSYPDYVEARIRQRCDDARAGLGVRRGSPEQLALAAGVRRERAWLEIVLLAATGLGFLLAVVW